MSRTQAKERRTQNAPIHPLLKTSRHPLAESQSTLLTRQAEQLFQVVSSAKRLGATPGTLVLSHRDGDLQVRFQGNARDGYMILSRGQSFYTRVSFAARKITIFQTQPAPYGFLRLDNAAVVERCRPRASHTFGRLPCLRTLLQASA